MKSNSLPEEFKLILGETFRFFELKSAPQDNLTVIVKGNWKKAKLQKALKNASESGRGEQYALSKVIGVSFVLFKSGKINIIGDYEPVILLFERYHQYQLVSVDNKSEFTLRSELPMVIEMIFNKKYMYKLALADYIKENPKDFNVVDIYKFIESRCGHADSNVINPILKKLF